tara:strand:- start:43 stop:606 length:564 start_codon:yes stop_codon:yes gene_type:complete
MKFKMKFKKESKEVLYSMEKNITLNKSFLPFLIKESKKNPKKIIRLCTHKNKKSPVHEMFIVQPKSYFCKPHKHSGEESMSVIKGRGDVVLFKDNGNIMKIIEMGDIRSNKVHYYKLSRNIFHILIIKSKYIYFHEVAKGPFKKSNMKSPPWAPGENVEKINLFKKKLKRDVSIFKKRYKGNNKLIK